MPSLIVNQALAQDIYVLGENLLTLDAATISEKSRFGIIVEGDAQPKDIAPLLPKLDMIAVRFPKVVDGRGYSLAFLLRQRLGFKGELRAVGDFTRDQLFYLQRTGFNAMTLRDGEDPQAALAAFASFSVRYQASDDISQPLFRSVTR